MPSWAVILKILNKVWPYIGGALLLLGAYVYVDHQGYKRAEVKKNAEIAKIMAKSAESEALAWRQKEETERRYAKQAAETDEALTGLRAELNANLLRYAKGGAVKSGSASTTGSSESDNRSGDSPQLRYDISDDTAVTITFKDAQLCVENTARLLKAHEWGLSVLADQEKSYEKPPTHTKTD